MFWPALFTVVLISSTIESLSAHKLLMNCTSFHIANSKPAHYGRNNENLACFKTKNASEHVHIRATVYQSRFLPFDFSLKECYERYVSVFDDCNPYSYSEKRLNCKVGYRSEALWSSKNSNCLKVQWYDFPKFNEKIDVYITYSNQPNLYKYSHRGHFFYHDYRSRKRKVTGRSSKRRSKPPVQKPKPAKCKDLYFESDRGDIWSPNYPNKYPANQDCTYIIEISEKRIQLVFRDVGLEKVNGSNKCKDYIEVYDGIASWSTVIRKICNDTVANTPIRLELNKLKIRFVSDGRNNFKGFHATYEIYQMAKEKDVTQKVTGVVIGTACGLVFLALTFLAICHSRRITLLHFVRGRYDVSNSDGPDAIQEKAPPSYDEVVASPHKYPLTPICSKHTKEHFLKTFDDSEEPPPYPGLVYHTEPGDETDVPEVGSDAQRIDVANNAEVDEATGSEVSENDVIRESEIRDNDVRPDICERNGSSDVIRRGDVTSGNSIRRDDARREGDDANCVIHDNINMPRNRSGKGSEIRMENGAASCQAFSRSISTDV